MTRWQRLPIVDDRAELVSAARRLQSAMYGIRNREMDHLARRYGVSLRTLHRYLNDSYLCPGYPEGSCLTKVRGGGLCAYCRKTKALA